MDDFDGCEVVTPEHPRYEMERRIFNGFIDRRPRALIFPESHASLVAAAKLLLERSEKFTVRAGGHNVAGSSLIDDGYVLDTSRLAHVSVDRERMVADVQPGALWRDFDSICAKFQLCTPGGIVSDTGVAGLTLGGGIGWLNGLYGYRGEHGRTAAYRRRCEHARHVFVDFVGRQQSLAVANDQPKIP